MRTDLRLGSLAGISIEINISWLIIVVLLTATLATGWFPFTVPGLPGWLYWVTAVIATLLFFGSVLAHELAHSLVARLRGLPVKSITLFVFGGVSNIEREPQSAVVEFQMAFIGPLTSLAIGGVMALAMFASAALGWPALLTAVLMYVGLANLALGVFNLIPGFPMDGGRVLRAIIWRLTGSLRKATQWAASVGQAIAFLMIFVGIWLFFSGDWVDGVWIGLIGLFILQAAQAEYTQVRLEATMAGATVQQFMTSSPPLATPDLLIEQVVDEYLLRTGQRTIPVVERDNNQLVGVVSLRDIRQIPRDRWDSTTVGQIMTPRSQLKTVQPDQPMSEALNTMTQARVGQLPVLSRDDRVIGMLDLTAVLEHLQLEHDLGVQRSEVNDVSNQPSQNPPLSKVG
jgi:Zn-dependent protease